MSPLKSIIQIFSKTAHFVIKGGVKKSYIIYDLLKLPFITKWAVFEKIYIMLFNGDKYYPQFAKIAGGNNFLIFT